jgi:hypothetical protein
MYNLYTVSEVEYADEGIYASAVLDEKGRGMYLKYIVE